MKLHGFTEEGLKDGGLSMPAIMVINYIATVLGALGLAMFIGGEGMIFGITAGVLVALFWIATSRLNDVLYEKQPFELYLINVGYYLVIYVLMGAIIGAWH